MITFFYLIIFIAALLAMMAMRLKPYLWISTLTIFLFAVTLNIPQHFFLLTISWVLFLMVALITLCKPLRLLLITQPIFKKLTTQLPPISLTEKQTIESGNTWWEKELFCGQPDFNFFKEISLTELKEEEKAFLEGPVEELCEMLNDWEITEKKQDLPEKIWDFLKEKKFFGLLIEKSWGGLQFSALAHSTIVMKIASRSITGAVTTMVPNSLGPGELIARYGTIEQKQYYLPRLAQGIEIPCFALTSLEAGSDATALTDTGVLCYAKINNEDQLCIRLNFNKRYITLAPIATLIGLAFKLQDPDHLLSDETDRGITLALLPAKQKGVEIGARHKPMHMAFMNGPIQGKDVLIPVDWVIGGASKIGKGWEMMMECLSNGRGISLPALATGNTRMAFCMTGAYAFLREQFHLSLGRFEGIQEILGRMGGITYLCEAVRLFTLSAIDSGLHPGIASAITKYQLTELGRQVGNDAMDIHAGRGIQRGPRNYLANLYDAIPVSITVEGANILTRSLMIFGQGALRCHPYLQKEIEAISNKAVNKFDTLFLEHIGFFLKNLSRTLLLNLGGYRLVALPFQGIMRPYAQNLLRMSVALALISDFAFILFKGELKRKESLSARLGDVLSFLYMASALLKYYESQSENREENVYFFQWGMEFCFYSLQNAFEHFFDNLIPKSMGYILRKLIFPFGRSYKPPSDFLNTKISSLMMDNSIFRNQISQNCYIKEIESEAVGRVELAFKACLETKPFITQLKEAQQAGKIKKAVRLKDVLESAIKENILTEHQAALVLEAEKKRVDSLEVDEF